MKKILSICWYTLKQNIRHKLFLVSLGAGGLMVLVSILLGEMAVSEQKRFILDFSLAISQIMVVFLAIITGSYQTREEIDKSITSIIISKAISRTQYLIGKYIGALFSVLLSLAGISLISLLVFWGQQIPLRPVYFFSLYTLLLESSVILAFAMFFSLISSSMIALSTTLGVTIIGHLSKDIYLLSQKGHGIPKLLGKMAYVVFPNLEKFNLKSMVTYATMPPVDLLLAITGYGLFIIMLLMLINSLIFDRIDIQ